MLVVQAVLCILVSVISYLLVQRYRFRRVLSHIPAPPGHWLIGNLDYILKNPHPGMIFDYLRDCAQKYGPIYRFTTLHIVTINLLHPDDMELVLSQMKHMKKSRIYQFLGRWLGEGLLTSTGLKWQKRRKLLTPAFHFNVLQKFLDVFNEETTNMVRQIEELNAQSPQSSVISLLPLVTNMTLQSITETALGVNSVEEEAVKRYRNNVHKMGRLIITRVTKPWRQIPLVYSVTGDFKEETETIDNLHQFTYRVMKEREKQLLNESHQQLMSTTYSGRKIMKMLDLLLYEKINNEGTIDYEGIREEVDTFMFEGHDTTAAAITFLLYTLAEHPDIQEHVRKEVESIIRPGRAPTFHDLQDLPYTERVIKETLRLYPSVPLISRVASEDFVTGTGYRIPKGTILHLQIFDMHRNPDIYPDPLRFDPDRFLPENCANRHPFAYLPFSAGPRNCIGQKFAILEIKAVIVGLLSRFRLVAANCKPPTFFIDLILRPEDDINIKFVPL